MRSTPSPCTSGDAAATDIGHRRGSRLAHVLVVVGLVPLSLVGVLLVLTIFGVMVEQHLAASAAGCEDASALVSHRDDGRERSCAVCSRARECGELRARSPGEVVQVDAAVHRPGRVADSGSDGVSNAVGLVLSNANGERHELAV